jgi:hypothetical protein
MTQSTKMTTDEMQAVLDAAQPDDMLRITFVADQPVDQYRIRMILVVCHTMLGETPYLAMLDGHALLLAAVHDTGEWQIYSYDAMVLPGFDADDFAYRTLRHGLLESITNL